MKIVEAHENILNSIRNSDTNIFKVDSIKPLGQTMLKSGPIAIRVKLDSNMSLRKGDTVTIDPVSLEVSKL